MANVKNVIYELTLPLKPRGNLVSFDYADVPAFMSLKKKCEKPDMFYLMSMEYQRIWMKKNNSYENSLKTKGNKVKPALKMNAIEFKLQPYTIQV
jgi:hypothetical protein